MNPLIKELQNIDMSRAFGPTISLGGEYVRVERELARQKVASETWKPPIPPEKTPAVATKGYLDRAAPMDWVEWVQFLIVLALFGPTFCYVVLVIPLACTRLSAQNCLSAIGWVSVIFCAGILAIVATTERRRAGSQRREITGRNDHRGDGKFDERAVDRAEGYGMGGASIFWQHLIALRTGLTAGRRAPPPDRLSLRLEVADS